VITLYVDRPRNHPFLVCLTRACTPRSSLFPYTTLFRSLERVFTEIVGPTSINVDGFLSLNARREDVDLLLPLQRSVVLVSERLRSEEHTSELQSHLNLVCRLLLEKKKNVKNRNRPTRLA